MPPIDPMMILLVLMVLVMVFFMFRNAKKNKERMETLRNNTRPGAKVFLEGGIYAEIVSIDEENNRMIVRSGDSTLEVHLRSILQIDEGTAAVVTDAAATQAPVIDDKPEDKSSNSIFADKDPEYGERK